MKNMNLYIIKYGLSGGFGGARDYEVIKTINLEDAVKWAEESAREQYQSYEGMHGLRTEQEIKEEDELDDEEANMTYHEEVDGWLDYDAQPWSRELQEEADEWECNNPYKEETDNM